MAGKDLRILLFGGSGVMGTAMEAVCAREGIVCIAPSHGDCDVTDPGAVVAALDRWQPTTVINGVALIGYEPCEADPLLAFRVNSLPAAIMARACAERGIVFVQMSSHAVFDGRAEEPYTEDDPPNPQNGYGATKLLGELYCRNLASRHYLVRLPTLFGPRRNNRPGFVDKVLGRIDRGEPLRIATDKLDSPTYSLDAAREIVALLQEEAPFGTYHLTNSGPVSYHDFVVALVELVGAKVVVEPALDSDFPACCKKPLRTPLVSVRRRPLRGWREALAEYLAPATLARIDQLLQARRSLDEIVTMVAAAGRQGKIAFYPCSRCTSDLLGLLRRAAPDAFANVACCFDRSSTAFAAEGVAVRPLEELSLLAPDLAAVIVTGNVFYGRELAMVRELVGPECNLLPVSGIDLELGRFEPEQLLADIRAVLGLLTDETSRRHYLQAWLARLLHDEGLTEQFAVSTPLVVPAADGAVFYRQYRLDNLPAEIVSELYLDVYTSAGVALGEGETALDVGAFKGDTAICFADRVGPAGRVYSFEPVRANFADLVRNVGQNGLETIVHPVNKGCGSACGRIRIATAPTGSPWAFFSPERGVEEIEVTTIDAFMAEEGVERVDFIKFDVEGVERETLLGAARTIAVQQPKLAISLYHNLVDLTELPLLVHSLGKYRLSLRCRAAGPWSIFLYAAPLVEG